MVFVLNLCDVQIRVVNFFVMQYMFIYNTMFSYTRITIVTMFIYKVRIPGRAGEGWRWGQPEPG